MNKQTALDPQIQAKLAQLQAQVAQLEQEVTELKQANHDLHVFYSLVENAPDAIAVANLQGIVTYVNASFKSLYGYGEESVGQPIPAFFPETEHPKLDTMLQELKTAGFWKGTITNLHKNGSVFPSHLLIVKLLMLLFKQLRPLVY